MNEADFSGLDDERRAELWATLALFELKGLGAAARLKLVEHFGSPYSAVQQLSTWAEAGLDEDVISRYRRGAWREAARLKWERIKNSGENILLYNDEAYPQLLREIPDAPLMLFYRGDLSLLHNPSLAVVGARKCTREGMSVAVGIVRGLSRAGLTTVSGMALGIDRVVHLAGLEGVGSSIAVLGCGVDIVYPKGNLDLYDLMQKKGLIISEFMPGYPPMKQNFPIRNRIISGLSRAVLVVEAAVRSGTLITARHAAEQGREVFAVPGSTISENSEGCRDLIRRGAKAVFSAVDIIAELAPILRGDLEEKKCVRASDPVSPAKALDKIGILPWDNQDAPPPQKAVQKKSEKAAPCLDNSALTECCTGLGEIESSILKFLNARQNCHIDTICNELGLEAAQASRTLIMLEVKGLVKRLPGMYYNISTG